MNTKTKNIIIDIFGCLVLIAGLYKEFFTDKPMPVWEWVIIVVVGVGSIAFTVKTIKGKLSTVVDKLIHKKLG